jgi:GH43 family beta-xylosidase
VFASDSKPVHSNPVYAGYFADPFVWKSGATYFAIGTGQSEACGRTAGKIFPVLQSTDFFHWHFVGGALVPPDAQLGTNFWAPEVVAENGMYYLYYSVGHGDKQHQLRVATSDMPQGPYHDVGQPLLDPSACAFAIDPHPFQDDDGAWYFFYATDFLDFSSDTRAGTALMVTPLKSMVELEGPGSPVLRARSDWQRFQQDRLMYDRVWDWHTLEGPFVIKRQQRYFCFYSGGRWENETYGVDYGVADSVLGPFSDAGNESGPRVLHTVPGHVIGPGHNCIVTGPDGETEYIVYHAWDAHMTARRMFIDRLDWSPEGPRCAGPSLATQNVPSGKN